MRRLGSNDPCGLVSCTRYGDVDEVSEALAPAGVEPVVRVPQAGAHILSILALQMFIDPPKSPQISRGSSIASRVSVATASVASPSGRPRRRDSARGAARALASPSHARTPPRPCARPHRPTGGRLLGGQAALGGPSRPRLTGTRALPARPPLRGQAALGGPSPQSPVIAAQAVLGGPSPQSPVIAALAVLGGPPPQSPVIAAQAVLGGPSPGLNRL